MNRLSSENLKSIIKATTIKTGQNSALLEKDYWICQVLEHLFQNSSFKNSFVFKGGTSLSKCFNLIQRFSEDVDLILDWRTLGYGLDEPNQARSNSKQDAFNKETRVVTQKFLGEKILPELNNAFKDNGQNLFELDSFDPHTIIFKYPKVYSSASMPNSKRIWHACCLDSF